MHRRTVTQVSETHWGNGRILDRSPWRARVYESLASVTSYKLDMNPPPCLPLNLRMQVGAPVALLIFTIINPSVSINSTFNYFLLLPPE